MKVCSFDEGRRDNMMTTIIEIMRTSDISRFINFVNLKMMENWVLGWK